MKAPNLPSFSESWPVPQVGQVRGFEPSPLSGKICGPRSSFRASRTCVVAQVLGLADGGREIAPEIAQDLLPVDLVVGDPVELLFEVGGEIVFHVAAEEAFQERDDEAALVLGNEALLLDPHIFAVAQDLQHRRIGGWAADAELFHALDEARLGEARRRLGEMLGRDDAAALERVALAHGRQAALVLVRLVVLALVVERQEAVELDHLAGGAQVELARADLRPGCRRWCARARPIPSGSRWCGSRSVRRGGPARVRGTSPRAWAGGRCRSGGWPRALPARSWPWSGICAARPARSCRRIPCR